MNRYGYMEVLEFDLAVLIFVVLVRLVENMMSMMASAKCCMPIAVNDKSLLSV